MTPQRWEPVDRFADSPAQHDVIAAVGSLASEEAARWVYGSSARAIVVPIVSLPSQWFSAAAPPGDAEVVFVDGARELALPRLLDAISGSRPLLIAFPEGTDATGLIEQEARLDVPTHRGTLAHRLFRLPEGKSTLRANLAAAPRLGEGTDVLDKRAEWFGTRSGGDG